jgi:hypothetical protein
MDVTETDLLDKSQALPLFFFRLAWKTDDNVGGDIDQWIDLP